MGKGVKTKFKGVYNDNTLPRFDKIVIHANKITTVTHLSCVRMAVQGNGVTVKTVGDGYFATTYAGLNDPSSRLTEYTISSDSLTTLYFKNDTYDIYVSGKYGKLSALSINVDSGSYNSIFKFNINELYYDENLIRCGMYSLPNVTGDITSVARHASLQYASFMGTSVSGSLLDFSECLNISELSLPTLSTKVEISEFVNAQVDAGRTTASIYCQNIKNAGVLFGTDIVYSGNTQGYIEWDTKDKIIVYLGNGTLANCDKIYAYGATAEEIAAWEAAGKTVVVVD